MGFKKENYTLKGICVCIYFLLITGAHSISGQSHCPIRVDYEPRIETQIRSANLMDEVKFPFFQMWENLENLRLSDDSRGSVVLPPNKRSTVFKGKNLSFSIPNGANIEGIELHIEGHTNGNGVVEGQMVRLLDESGTAVGENASLNPLPTDQAWAKSTDTTDFHWRYGAEDDTWNLNLTKDIINSLNFGYALQVRNKLNESVSVSIDHVYIIVYYTPLYEMCSTHACVPFYIDEIEDPLVTYEWYIPQGFELISGSEHDAIINIGASYAEFGEYEICVESFYKQQSLGICCRSFNYLNCDPASISGEVFFDLNNDNTKSNADPRLSNIQVNLYSEQGDFVQKTTTDNSGSYSFSPLLSGAYYLEIIENIDSLIFALPNIGDETIDSDITATFGTGTTNSIVVDFGDEIDNIDAGLARALSIGNFVWEDLNGDGIQQINEPGIKNVEVKLQNSSFNTLSTFTDDEGKYEFSGLLAGDYNVFFSEIEGFEATIPNATDSNFDNDFIPGNPLSLSFLTGGEVDSIDAGFFRLSQVGDFVWEDLNDNGLQDDGEPGIRGIKLSLIDNLNQVIQTVKSDSLGFYTFENIAPGEYHIEAQQLGTFTLTAFQIDGGLSNEIDSDLFNQDGRIVSPTFLITSNSTFLDLDFGFVQRPAMLGGFTFLDSNNNGQYDAEEGFVPEINVLLYNTNNILIDSTQSDQGGFYLFENVLAGTYYVTFDLPQTLLFTLPDVGDDLSDSDVTNSFGNGNTEFIVLVPGEENLSLSAGYQNKAKVGDYVWLDENGNGIQDPEENGINGVLINLYDEQGNLSQSTFTLPNLETGKDGHYQFVQIPPGNYYLRAFVFDEYNFAIVDESAVGMNSIITDANGEGTSNIFNLAGNDCNFDLDIGYAFKKGNITGEVWIDQNKDGIQNVNEEFKSGVQISLLTLDGTLVSETTSDENGAYAFTTLDAGPYFLIFTPGERYQFTSPFATSDTDLDSHVTNENAMGSTPTVNVTDGITVENVDAGLIDGVIDLNGITWIDANGDGIQGMNEASLPNVQVTLYDLNDSLLASTQTSLEGTYTFENVIAGAYYLVFDANDDSYINTIGNQGMNDDLDDDVTSIFGPGSTDVIVVDYFLDLNLINAGFYQLSSIGDQVFIDANENNINDNEAGLNDVIVNLIELSTGGIVASDTTAQGGGLDSGYYKIENIPPGIYTVEFIRPLFYQFVEGDQGSDDALDSDVIEIIENKGSTSSVEIFSGTENTSIDAGLFFQIPTESSISGSIWEDTNTNGLRDAGESPVPMVELSLEDQNGQVIAVTESNEEGDYSFDNLAEGFYKVAASLNSNKAATFPNLGGDETIDSDFIETPTGLSTESFFLSTFEDLEHVDLGIGNKLKLGDFVWEDANNNGVQDAGELGVEEIEITVSSENGLIEKTIMSGANGEYQIDNLASGFYKICVNLPSGFNFAKSNIGTDVLDSDIDSTGCTDFIDFSSGGVVTDLDVGLTKNGSIEGVAFVDFNGNGVNNLNDPGLDGITVSLFTANGNFVESTQTNTIDDISGSFKFLNLKATDYYIVFDYPADYIITSPDIGDDFTDSDITGQFGVGSTDIFAVPSGGIVTNISGGAYLPASIGNEVWLDENEDGLRGVDEVGVAGIEVVIFRSFGVPFDTTTTDENGVYQFLNLKQGLYFIQFMIPQEFSISPSDQGVDDNIDSDADITGKTPLISLAHGAGLESVDCGIYSSTASLRSIVWNDINGDGIRQNTEARIPGIQVVLMDSLDNSIDSMETNSLGLYAFQQIPEGSYKIHVNIDETDYAFTSMNMSDDDFHDSDIKVTGYSEMFTSDVTHSCLSVPNVDAGLYEGGEIISIVWEDTDADGIFNLEESALSNIEVKLYSLEGKLINRTISTENEDNVTFQNIAPGKYYLHYDMIQGYVPSPASNDALIDNNNDAFKIEGMYISPVFQVLSNEAIIHIDAGFYKGSSIVSTVWYDINKNGIQDDIVNSPENMYASLYTTQGKNVGTQKINLDGEIQFSGIPKGAYYLKYHSPKELDFTVSHEGSEVNSDVTHLNGWGTTDVIYFEPYDYRVDIDAGILTESGTAATVQVSKEVRDRIEERSDESNEQEKITFEVFPNPAANYLKLKFDAGRKGVINIRNSQNQLIFTGRVENTEQIDLSHLHPGIYYAQYDNGFKSIIKKFIKIQ
ncbi:MAG: SdrD B-like domain-containing protein [Saprospiraceae bacterium]|nr:SdrD B-like domain-containing protein [Saprospiraceae bacterium]